MRVTKMRRRLHWHRRKFLRRTRPYGAKWMLPYPHKGQFMRTSAAWRARKRFARERRIAR